MENTFFNQVFQDRDGKIVTAQMPNLPFVIWTAACLLQMTFSTGKINTGLDFIAFGSLFTWAWGELFQGVNYFRRTLGLIVLISIVALRIQ
jgi:hypothetical protein